MKTMIITTLVFCSLVGCANTNKSTAETSVISPPPQKPVVAIPSWYNQQPSSEENLYSVGTAASRDLQLSLDMAILNAKTNLADRLNSRVKAQTKIFSNQSSSGDSYSNKQQIERAVKNSIADVDVAGYVVAKSETLQQDGVFRTFVMLEYSREKSAGIIMDRIRSDKNPKSDFNSAFEELDKLSISK
jgi:hypothetical protein